MRRPSASSAPVRVLITGAHGFVGSVLVPRLAARFPDWRLDAPVWGSSGGERSLDLTDADQVARRIAERPPEVVIHLAAVAAVTAALDDPRRAWEVNLGGTLNLALALQAHAPHVHLMFASSAEIYGLSLLKACPTSEDALLQPTNAYAASKAAADLLVRQMALSDFSASIMRPFNHTGPGQSEAFVAPSLAAQIARIEAGLAEPVLKVGQLDAERDFLDVEDVVSAYLAVLEARTTLAPAEVFNVASGKAVRIGDALEFMLARAHVKMRVEQDPARMRRSAIPRAVGDATRIRNQLGWRPTIPLEHTLSRLLDHHRAQVRKMAT